MVFTSAVLKTFGHFPEGHVVSAHTVINALFVTAEILDSVLLKESAEFVVNFVLSLKIFFDSRVDRMGELSASLL